MTVMYDNLKPVEFTFRCQGSKPDGTQCDQLTENTHGVPAGLWRCDGHRSAPVGPEWIARENARRVRDGLAPIVDPATSPAARAGLKHGPGGRGGPGPCDPGCRKCVSQGIVNEALTAGRVLISKEQMAAVPPEVVARLQSDNDAAVKALHQRAVDHLTRCGQSAAGGQCLLRESHRADAEHHWNGEHEWTCYFMGSDGAGHRSTHSSEMASDAMRGVCPKCFVSPDVDLHDTFRCAHGLRPARREEFVPTPAPAPTKPATFNVGDHVRGTTTHQDIRWYEGTVETVYHEGISVRVEGGSHHYKRGDLISYCNPENVRKTERPQPDPLDVEYDGVKLRDLLDLDRDNRREAMKAGDERRPVVYGHSPVQRAAVSAHWSAQLRAKVEASAAAERERERNRVVLDTDEDMPWRTW